MDSKEYEIVNLAHNPDQKGHSKKVFCSIWILPPLLPYCYFSTLDKSDSVHSEITKAGNLTNVCLS